MSSELENENPSIVSAQTIVRALISQGVTWAAYCAGSRSAPFAYALAQAEKSGLINVATFVDERSAGFWAVGVAKSLRAPVVVITTSGTAVAELHPALEEAKYQRLPIIALTADRPFELRQVGASQTTRQQGIFGSSVIDADDIPAEDSWPEPRRRQLNDRVRRLVKATHGSGLNGGGPVHLNVSFRDPLTPTSAKYANVEVGVTENQIGTSTCIRNWEGVLPKWNKLVKSELSTVVIAGDQSDPQVIEAAGRRRIPVLGEPTSGACESEAWIAHSAVMLPVFATTIQQVVVTGRPTLSRQVNTLLARPDLRIVVISPESPWVDLAGTAIVVCQGIVDDTAPRQLADESADTTWLGDWLTASARVEEAIHRQVDADLNLFSVCRTIWEADQNTQLWLGASNTIRGFDLAASSPGRDAVFSNRGLAGIDGTIASALGMAMASERPVRAVMGDLTFCYDVGTLSARPTDEEIRLQIIVIDDGGGSIFASLEHGQPQFASIYPKYFAINKEINVAQAAQAFGWVSVEINDLEQLRRQIAQPITGKSILWVRVPEPTSALKKIRALGTSMINSDNSGSEE